MFRVALYLCAGFVLFNQLSESPVMGGLMYKAKSIVISKLAAAGAPSFTTGAMPVNAHFTVK